jgi:hypothetical protein
MYAYQAACSYPYPCITLWDALARTYTNHRLPAAPDMSVAAVVQRRCAAS